jgi:hypothetical protein
VNGALKYAVFSKMGRWDKKKVANKPGKKQWKCEECGERRNGEATEEKHAD